MSEGEWENDTYQAVRSFVVNISGSEANFETACVQMNGVKYGRSCSGTGSYYCNKSFSGFADGRYAARMNDSSGNFNSTETRFVATIGSCLEQCNEEPDCNITNNKHLCTV